MAEDYCQTLPMIPDVTEDELYVLENGEWRQLESANTTRTYQFKNLR